MNLVASAWVLDDGYLEIVPIECVLKLIITLVRQLYCRTFARLIEGRQYNCRPNKVLHHDISGHSQLIFQFKGDGYVCVNGYFSKGDGIGDFTSIAGHVLDGVLGHPPAP